jgi:hypothetical protein
MRAPSFQKAFRLTNFVLWLCENSCASLYVFFIYSPGYSHTVCIEPGGPVADAVHVSRAGE